MEDCGEGLDEKWLLRGLLLEPLWHLGKGIIHSLINSHHSECHCSESVQLAASGSDDIFDFNWKAGPWLFCQIQVPQPLLRCLLPGMKGANCHGSDLKQALRVCLLSCQPAAVSESSQACDGVFDSVGRARNSFWGCFNRHGSLSPESACPWGVPWVDMQPLHHHVQVIHRAATSSDSPGGCNRNCEKTELWNHRNQAVRLSSGCSWKLYPYPHLVGVMDNNER